MKAKALLDSTSKELSRLDDYLSRVITYSYDNTMLLCNPITSRNPFSSSLIAKVVRRLPSGEGGNTKTKVFFNLLRYYFKSFAFFVFFVLHFFTFKISRLRFNKEDVDKSRSLIVVSTFTMIDKIYPKGQFEDSFFGALYEVMERRENQYVILCFLFGDKPWNLKRRVQTYNFLAKDGRSFVTEFDLMNMREWIELVKFIVVYPLATLRLLRRNFGEFDDLFRQEIVNTLDTTQFPNYVKYLTGRKLSLLNNQSISIISWYENQVTDKLLFRGIRESGVDSKIYGCQFFDKPPLWKNLYPMPQEHEHRVLPDVILVSGSYYLDENSNLNIKLGLSPRYNYLFDIDPGKNNVLNRQQVLVLLTYDIEESKRIINMAKSHQNKNPNRNITIKLHPNHLLRRPFTYPQNWKYTEERLSNLCVSPRIVVTGCSSAALESAVMGCSVIILVNGDGLTFNPMPEYGRGKIWDMVFTAEDFEEAMVRLIQYRDENPDEVVGIARALRSMFFTRATEERYIELFDL